MKLSIYNPVIQNFAIANFREDIVPETFAALIDDTLKTKTKFKHNKFEISGDGHGGDWRESVAWGYDAFYSIIELGNKINALLKKYNLPVYASAFGSKRLLRIVEYTDNRCSAIFSILIFDDNTFYPLNGWRGSEGHYGECEIIREEFLYGREFFYALNRECSREFDEIEKDFFSKVRNLH